MEGFLSGAVYTAHYGGKKSLEVTQWEQLRQVTERLVMEQDAIPLAGTTAGLMIGGLVIIIFFVIWYLYLHRNRRSSREEYVNILSVVSRATSDNSHYKRQPPKKQSLWNQLLRKTRPSSPVPRISGPACYLMYEPDNSGQLVQYYSKIPLDLSDKTVVAIWKPASHISSHKFTENAGRSVLITNCTIGFQGKHNYCKGICKFLQTAFPSGGGTITLFKDPPIATDVYLYLNDTRPQYQTFPLEVGKTRTIPPNSLAVACLPETTPFYKNNIIDMYKWLEDGERQGSSIRF